MYASDHRARARAALKGKWLWAIVITLVASLLGGISTSSSVEFDLPSTEFNFNIGEEFDAFDDFDEEFAQFDNMDPGSLDEALDEIEWDFDEMDGLLSSLIPLVIGLATFGALIGLTVSTVFSLFVGGPVAVGYGKYTLNLMDGKPADFGTLFSQFNHMGRAVKYRLLKKIITVGPVLVMIPVGIILIWLLEGAGAMLLFWLFMGIVVFDIIISYSLAVGEFVLADDENCTASDAMRISWGLMEGNRWRYFCLEFSFIGWQILAGFTFGIGALVLNPYIQVAYASFYRELRPAVNAPVRETPAENYYYEEVYEALPQAIPEVQTDPGADSAQ